MATLLGTANSAPRRFPSRDCGTLLRSFVPGARLFVSRWSSVSTHLGRRGQRSPWSRRSKPRASKSCDGPKVESDRLPESRWKAFNGGMIGRLGLNPALARRVVTPVGDAWVVPGNGYIGLEVRRHRLLPDGGCRSSGDGDVDVVLEGSGPRSRSRSRRCRRGHAHRRQWAPRRRSP